MNLTALMGELALRIGEIMFPNLKIPSHIAEQHIGMGHRVTYLLEAM